MSDTPRPRVWTLGLPCGESVEVIEKAAYDAAVERAERAKAVLDRITRINPTLQGLSVAQVIARDFLAAQEKP